MILSDFLARVRTVLMDAGALIWSDALLTEATRQALDDYTLIHPVAVREAVTLPASGELVVDLSTLTGFVDILYVDYPYGIKKVISGWSAYYDHSKPMLRIRSKPDPSPGEELLLTYCQVNTIEGLDLATVTTVDPRHISILVNGAAAYAARMRAIDRAEGFRNDGKIGATVKAWGDTMAREFAQDLNRIKRRFLLSTTGTGWDVEG